MRCNSTAASCQSSIRNDLGTYLTQAGRVYIYFASLPNAGATLVYSGLPSTTGPQVYFNQSDSKIYARVDSTNGASGVVVTTGQWYLVSWLFVINTGASDTCDVTVGTTACGQATATGHTAAQTFWGFGWPVNLTADVFYDDVVISNTSADHPIGAGYVNHFVPTADGTHNIAGTADFTRTLTGTDILNATTTAYQLIDDVPLESGASVDWINMVLPPNATDYVECVYGPASGISTPTVAPRAVEVIAGYHQAGTATGNMEIRLNDNGTTNAVYTATAVGGVTSVAYARKHYATAPTGGAWTVVSGAGNFNNLRLRFGSPAAVDANPDQYLDCVMIEAEFAEVPAGPPVGVLYKNTRAGASAIQRASRW